MSTPSSTLQTMLKVSPTKRIKFISITYTGVQVEHIMYAWCRLLSDKIPKNIFFFFVWEMWEHRLTARPGKLFDRRKRKSFIKINHFPNPGRCFLLPMLWPIVAQQRRHTIDLVDTFWCRNAIVFLGNFFEWMEDSVSCWMNQTKYNTDV